MKAALFHGMGVWLSVWEQQVDVEVEGGGPQLNGRPGFAASCVDGRRLCCYLASSGDETGTKEVVDKPVSIISGVSWHQWRKKQSHFVVT